MWPQGLGAGVGLGVFGAHSQQGPPCLSSCSQDISLKLAFMKNMVQVTDAIKNIKDLEDFQFSQKVTLTGIIMVSHLGGSLRPGQSGGLTLLT